MTDPATPAADLDRLEVGTAQAVSGVGAAVGRSRRPASGRHGHHRHHHHRHGPLANNPAPHQNCGVPEPPTSPHPAETHPGIDPADTRAPATDLDQPGAGTASTTPSVGTVTGRAKRPTTGGPPGHRRRHHNHGPLATGPAPHRSPGASQPSNTVPTQRTRLRPAVDPTDNPAPAADLDHPGAEATDTTTARSLPVQRRTGAPT
jgi:hypothetical protein